MLFKGTEILIWPHLNDILWPVEKKKLAKEMTVIIMVGVKNKIYSLKRIFLCVD